MNRSLAIALIGSLFTAASHAAPLITFQVKAVQEGSSPDAIISADGSHVSIWTGYVVLQLLAHINSLDGDLTNDAMIKATGSWVTAGTTLNLGGFLRGDSSTFPGVNNVVNFTGVGTKSGVPAELSGTIPGNTNDSIRDIGGTSKTTFTNYFVAVSNTVSGQVGQSFLIGETLLDVTDIFGSTTVRFVPRTVANSGAQSNRYNIAFRRDGTTYTLNGDGSPTNMNAPDPDAIQFRAVTITTPFPEPSTFTLLAPGLLALAGLRRRHASLQVAHAASRVNRPPRVDKWLTRPPA